LANETGCRQWLERCQEHNVLPDVDVLNEETLFASVRESRWYKNLVPEQPQEEQGEVQKEIVMPTEDEDRVPAHSSDQETNPTNA